VTFQGGGALLDHGLEFVIVDVGEGDVEDVAGLGDDGREEAVEEYGVEDACWRPWELVYEYSVERWIIVLVAGGDGDGGVG
jgi:hypothetical protein